MQNQWHGVFPAATTQFHQDESLDLDATQHHLQVVIDSGVQGLVMLGSLGENNALSRAEKLDVVRCAKNVTQGKIPVISGVSELNTQAACEYVVEAEKAGADGFMVLPAMAYHSDPIETVAHLEKVASSTSRPIIIYNNPLAYKVDITPPMLEKLASNEQFVAVKESSGDIRRITDIFNQVGDRYAVFSGVDDLTFEAVMLGATGWISGIGLAFPAENQHLWHLMMAGKWDEARAIYRWYTPALHLDVGNKFVQNIKLAIQEAGYGKEWVRMPRQILQGAERDSVLSTIRKVMDSKPDLTGNYGTHPVH